MKVLEKELTDEIKKLIFEGFAEHATSATGKSELGEDTAFVIEDEQNGVVAAVVCRLFWGALHIKYLWTHKDFRGKGYATKLMKKVLEFGEVNNCPFATVETMSFQASGFYEKFGFVAEYESKGYSKGVSFIHLRKELRG